jgi:tetratricopeptide (TPR) repeat protein
MIGFLLVSALAVIAWRKGHRAWLVAWLMYLVALSPVLGLIQVGSQGAADRYAYLPTLPAYVFLGYGLRIALNHSNFRRIATLAMAFAVIVVLTLTTKQQVLVWKNELSLWTQAVESYPESIFARENLAITHLNLGNYEFAAYHFEKSEELSPAPTRNIGWRGLAYLNLGRYEEAIEDHINLGISSEEIPELVVDQHCIQYNIGWLYAHLNMPEEAIELMQRVLPNERYGPDALTWLEYLENVDLTGDGNLVLDGLPGYCKTLIPSRVWVDGVLQK